MESYLEECLDSVCQQLESIKSCEIILINDGSTDQSLAICEEYNRRYSQIHLISQTNQGLSAARNRGIAESQGNYVMFIDSDDYIARDLLTHIKQEILQHECDVYFLEGYKVYPNGYLEHMDNSYQMDLENQDKIAALATIAGCNKFLASPCTKICKRSLIVEHELWFEPGRISEDIAWSVKVYLQAETFGTVHGSAYYYRQGRNSSITNRVTEKRFIDLQYAISQGIEAADLYPQWKTSIYSMMAYETEVLILLYGQLDRSYRQKHENGIRALLWLLDYRKGKRTRCIALACRFIGIKRTSVLLAKLFRVREKKCRE